MRKSNWLLAGLVAASFVALPTIASAQETLNVKRSEHPLTSPKGYLSPFGIFGFTKIDGIDDMFIRFDLGADYSITDDFQVGATVLPLSLSPDADYGNPTINARYRFLRSAVEVAGDLKFTIPVQDGANAALNINVPILFGLSLNTRLQLTPSLILTFADPDMTKHLSVPLDFVVNFTDTIFLTAGISLEKSLEDGGRTDIPLNVGFGYTVAAPHIDLQAGIGFPSFIRAGGYPDGVDTFGAGDVFVFTLGATAHFQ